MEQCDTGADGEQSLLAQGGCFKNGACTVHRTVRTVRCTVHTVRCTVRTVRRTVHTVHTIHTVHCNFSKIFSLNGMKTINFKDSHTKGW